MAGTPTTAPVHRRFGKAREAAALLDVDPSTLRRYVAEGKLTAYRIGQRNLRYDLDEVAALAKPVPTTGNRD